MAHDDDLSRGRVLIRNLVTVCTILVLFTTSSLSSAAETVSGESPDIWGGGKKVDVERIWGDNRFGTSEAVAEHWDAPVDVAYVVSGRNYPDALATAARAGKSQAPVLLTDTDQIPLETARSLRRLKPKRIVAVGGRSVLSTSMVKSLGQYTRSVERIDGPTRYETSAALAEIYKSGVDRVYLASGASFPEALVTSALAGYEGMPLLLTRSNRLDAATTRQLRRLKPKQVVVVGNSQAVNVSTASDAASHSTSGQFRRISGADSYATAGLVAEQFPTGSDTAFVASGQVYPDALVGSALAAREGGPVLLTPHSTVPSSTARALEALDPSSIRILGGTASVGDSIAGELRGDDETTCRNPLPKGTLYGSSLSNKGEPAAASLQKVDDSFGRVPLVRQFSTGLPSAWASHKMRSMEGRTIVTSFKVPPRDINSGKYDSYLRKWFATAPTDQDIYWSYYHEPEGEIKAGLFSATEYRQAWKRIGVIADDACKPNMYSTLILTGWTAKPASKQDYRDYDAGPEVIDVLAFDSYNGVNDPSRDYYASPEEMYGHIVAIAKREGRPFAIPETGTRLLPDDDGSKRAQWLREVGTYLDTHGSLFVSYFQSDRKINWRLDDEPSRKAWSALVQR